MIEVTVDDVEVAQLAQHLTNYHRPRRDEILIGGLAVPGCLLAGRYQARRSLRVARGKQSHLVTSPHQLLGERVNDALGASVPNWWHSLKGRRELGDPHALFLPL